MSAEATREDPRRGECSHLNSRSRLVSGSLSESVQPVLHLLRVTVWCALLSKVVIVPYFFHNSVDAVTVNAEHYLIML